MFFSLLYLALRALLGLVVRSRRGPDVKDVELLVLRHELGVLRRQAGRPRFRRADRALLAAAACHLPRSSALSLLVTPRTLLRWHRSLVRWKWRRYSKRPGRPRLSSQVRELVLRLARRIRAEVIGASAENSPSSASLCRRRASDACSPGRGWVRRRGVRARVGRSSCTPTRRASSLATSSVRHEALCEKEMEHGYRHLYPCWLGCWPRADAAAR